MAETHLYAIAIGSNRPHGRFGRPAAVVEAAIARLDADFGLFDASPIILNSAIGGAGRDFANAVAVVESPLDVRPTLALQGRHAEREPDTLEARFVLRVVHERRSAA